MSFTDPSLGLQGAIVQRLKDDASVTAIVTKRVYDSVPANAVPPYVAIGPSFTAPELSECTDAAETSIQVDVWSRSTGFPEVKRAAAAVIAALHDADIPLSSGGTIQSLLLESVRYLRDPDGLTSHAVITFNILTDAN